MCLSRPWSIEWPTDLSDAKVHGQSAKKKNNNIRMFKKQLYRPSHVQDEKLKIKRTKHCAGPPRVTPGSIVSGLGEMQSVDSVGTERLSVFG